MKVFLFCTRFLQGSKIFGGSYFSILLCFEADLRVQAEGLYTTKVINGEWILADLKTGNSSISFIVQAKPDNRP